MIIQLLLVVSFLSLFMAIFWMFIIRLHEHKFVEPTKPKKFPKVTVIVPSKNGAKTIVSTIKAILASNYPKDKLDVLVALNGCTDNTAKVVKPLLGKRVHLVEYSFSNKARAMNKSLKHVKGEILSCVDDDSIIDKDALRYMVTIFEEQNVAAGIPICRVYNPKTFLQKTQFVEYQVSTFARRLLSAVDALFTTPGVLGTYRKDKIIEVGGFDENSLTEDIEIAMNLTHAGYLVRSQIKSKTYTKVPHKLSVYDRQRLRWSRGFIESVWKHREMLFNPKHGFLGMFMLPLVITVTILISILAAVLIYSLTYNGYFFLYSLAALGTPFVVTASTMWFSPVLIITTIILVLLGAYLLNKSYKHTEGRWRFPIATLFYFTFYQTIVSFYWLRAFLFTFANVKKKW